MRERKELVPQAVPKLLLTVDEAAQALSLGRTFVYGLVMRKHLFSVKAGARRLIPVTELRAYVRRLSELEGVG